MKIAILTSGILPVPAVQGGAVENLIDFYLEYNNQYHLHDITVYSVWHPSVRQHPSLCSEVNHYHYIDTVSIMAKFRRKLYGWVYRKRYYNHFIEFFFSQACSHLLRQDYDCIIIENRPGYALKLAEKGVTGLVLHLHNDLLNSASPNCLEIYDSLKQVLTVSDYIKGRVETIQNLRLSFPNTKYPKVTTVCNGIDLKRFTRQAAGGVSRESVGFSVEDFVLVYSGRINTEKGIAQLIDSMLLLKDLPRLRLMVIGSTFFGNADNEDDFVRMLKEKARPIQERIIFTGFIPYGQMPDYLQIADVAVIPSVWDDPFPTTVLEAQAMGLPIITSNRGGIPEEVSVDNAIIVNTELDYVERLAQAIGHLYNSPQQVSAMAAASLRRSVRFDKERFAADLFAALEATNSNHQNCIS